MKKNSNTKGIFVVLLSSLSIIVLSSTTYLSDAIILGVQDDNQKRFFSILSGEKEVPPVQTDASGMAWFEPKQDSVWFQLNVKNLQGITNAHIHIGKQGENGPPPVQLYHSDTPTILIDGKLFSGTLYTNKDTFVAKMTDKQLSDLVSAMRDGEAYVDVHTQQNPNGEIRGQIKISDSTSINNDDIL